MRGGRNALGALALGLAMLSAALPRGARTSGAGTGPDAPLAAQMAAALTGERAAVGLGPVAVDAALVAAAEEQAAGMDAAGRLSHQGFDTIIRRHGWAVCARGTRAGFPNFGQGIGWNYSSAGDFTKGLLGDPAHRRDALDPVFNRCGAARHGAYWVFNYGASCR